MVRASALGLRISFLLLATALFACGDDDGGGGSDASTDAGVDAGLPASRVELGVGRSVVDPFPADGRLPIVYGVQGGFHLDLGVRLFNLDPQDLILRYEMTRVSNSEILGDLELRLTPRRVVEEGAALVRAGDQVIFTTIAAASELDEEMVNITVTATPVVGMPATDEREVTVVDEGR